jgi:uncharacterized membrane protein
LVSAATVVLWLHLLAAMFWVGGQIFLVAVVLPALRRAVAPDERARLAAAVGRQYLYTAWIALTVLVGTGIANAVLGGVTWASLTDTTYGHILAVKAALVMVVLALTAVHGLYYGGRLEELARHARADARAAARYKTLQRRSVRLSAINLFLNLVIVLLAAQLATIPS